MNERYGVPEDTPRNCCLGYVIQNSASDLAVAFWRSLTFRARRAHPVMTSLRDVGPMWCSLRYGVLPQGKPAAECDQDSLCCT